MPLQFIIGHTPLHLCRVVTPFIRKICKRNHIKIIMQN